MSTPKPSGKPIRFQLGNLLVQGILESRVTKDDLYGRAVVIVEKDGRRLQKGTLLSDGSLIRKEEISTLALDPEGSPVESARTLIDGLEATPEISSLKRVNTLQKVLLTTLAGFSVSDVYPLASDEAGTQADGVATSPLYSLEPGLYETTFNYRDSVDPRRAYLLIRQRDGSRDAFLLTGVGKQATFLSEIVPYEFFDAAAEAEGDEDGDLDFSMV